MTITYAALNACLERGTTPPEGIKSVSRPKHTFSFCGMRLPIEFCDWGDQRFRLTYNYARHSIAIEKLEPRTIQMWIDPAMEPKDKAT